MYLHGLDGQFGRSACLYALGPSFTYLYRGCLGKVLNRLLPNRTGLNWADLPRPVSLCILLLLPSIPWENLSNT